MDEEQRKWHKRYTKSLGARELFRLAMAVIGWLLTGIVISIFTGSSVIFDIFFIALFAFTFIAPKWKPAYDIFRKIVGTEDLPIDPFPRPSTKLLSQARPWWSYLPSVWWLIMELILFLLALGYLSKK